MGTSSFLVVRDMAKVTNMWGSWSVYAGGCCLLKCYWSTSGIGELTCVWECSSWFLIWEGARKLGGSNTLHHRWQNGFYCLLKPLKSPQKFKFLSEMQVASDCLLGESGEEWKLLPRKPSFKSDLPRELSWMHFCLVPSAGAEQKWVGSRNQGFTCSNQI